MADPIRVEIGFKGGQIIHVRLEPERVSKLIDGIRASDGWSDLQTADGEIAVDLADVSFVRSEESEHEVGFRS